jgi:hypothetical protein
MVTVWFVKGGGLVKQDSGGGKKRRRSSRGRSVMIVLGVLALY